MQFEERRTPRKRKPVTLKTIADRVGLAPCSISAVLNNSPAARAIPQHTKERVLQAASQLKYQPNFAARSLRTRRTHTVAVIARDLACAQVAAALAGIERGARTRGYLLAVTSWDGAPESLPDHFFRLGQRGVEGLILIDGLLHMEVSLPTIMLQVDETPQWDGGIADGRQVRAEGERAAHTLVDQVEALARMGSSHETMFWRANSREGSVSLS